jgi:hypothetical protein
MAKRRGEKAGDAQEARSTEAVEKPITSLPEESPAPVKPVEEYVIDIPTFEGIHPRYMR